MLKNETINSNNMENTTEKNTSFFRFEDLRIYNKALDFTEWVHESISFMTSDDKQNIGGPMLKAAQNIAINIAEGSARNKSQFVYYLKMAKSSVRECLVLNSICHKLHLISDEKEEEGRKQLMELTKMVGALIASLQKSQGANNQDEKQSEDVDYDD